MVQIPDSIRPYVSAVVKFHFWILAAIAPVVLLPLLFVAQGSIAAKIETQRGKIKSAIDSLKTITSKSPHPNEKWSKQIGGRANEIDDDTLRAWTQLWDAQQPIRQWPESLGKDFVKAATSLKPDGTLRRSLLERYQNGVRSVVRQLPGRMGADELMTEAAAGEGAGIPRAGIGPGVGPGERDERLPSLLQWSADDQQSLFNSFDWLEPPSTTQVVLSQEELWMYGVLCDVIKEVNSVPVGPDPQVVITPANIPIRLVQQVRVGYPAAEDDPGGRSGKRIMKGTQAAAGFDGGMPPPESMMMGPEAGVGAMGRPAHPRFSGVAAAGGGMPPGMPSMPGGPGDDVGQAGPPDDILKSWIYVDLEGKPLTAADLAAAPLSNMVRLMPFVLKCTVDQRALDALLVALTSAPVPIDTRQVRINADTTSGAGIGQPRFADSAPPGAAGAAGDRPRLHDLNVEVRGTLAIMMPPDRSLLQGGATAENAE